jgi:uncharacterized DUF497 family protein
LIQTSQHGVTTTFSIKRQRYKSRHLPRITDHNNPRFDERCKRMTVDEGEFEWDAAKAESNWIKHSVSFAEAMTVFKDFGMIYHNDIEHSITEEREIVIGYSTQNRLLTLSITEKENGKIRIISARKSVPIERKQYENA